LISATIDLMHYCRKYKPADILVIPDVRESVHLFLGMGDLRDRKPV
jgi:hypothetical protein